MKQKALVLDARMINNSGIGRYIKALIPALIECSSKVTLIGRSKDFEKFDWFKNVNIIELNVPIYTIAEQFAIFFKTPKCNVFISPHYNSPVWLPQADKVAVIIPDTNPLELKDNLSVIKRLYANIFFNISARKDYVFTISEFSKSEIVRFTNVSPQKIVVAKCAIDKKYFRSLETQLKFQDLPFEIFKYGKIKYILYIGNVKPHKNLKRAVLAFEKVLVNQPGIIFLIVGKKDNFITADKEIFSLVEENEALREKVIFTGHISDLHLAFLYREAMLFLFPSLYEGFGLPPLEAMFFGCPVISSREGSLPEVCGDAAYYCDAYDVNDIASSIEELFGNDLLRTELIERGRKKVDEYDWSVFNDTIINGLNQPSKDK